MLRRLEKRILVDLPTEEAREAMFKHHLPHIITPESHGLELRADVDYRNLAKVREISPLPPPLHPMQFHI